MTEQQFNFMIIGIIHTLCKTETPTIYKICDYITDHQLDATCFTTLGLLHKIKYYIDELAKYGLVQDVDGWISLTK
jgi:hypothetical protein